MPQYRSYSIAFYRKLMRRCADAEWVETPLGQLAQLLLDTDMEIPVAMLSEILDVHRPNIYRWLRSAKCPGRSKEEIESNNTRINTMVAAIRYVLVAKQELTVENIRAAYELSATTIHRSDTA